MADAKRKADDPLTPEHPVLDSFDPILTRSVITLSTDVRILAPPDVRKEGKFLRTLFVGDAEGDAEQVRSALMEISSYRPVQQENITSIGKVVVDPEQKLVLIDEVEMEITTVLDASSLEQFSRPVAGRLDAIVLFYCISDRTQFDHIKYTWIPMVRQLFLDVPLLICATGVEVRMQRSVRRDLLCEQLGVLADGGREISAIGTSDERESTELAPGNYESVISSEMGRILTEHFHGAAYLEVSTNTFEGIEELYSVLVKTINASRDRKDRLFRNCRPKPKDACVLL